MVHAVPGRQAVREALRAGRELREVVVEERRDGGAGPLEELTSAAVEAGVPVRRVRRGALDDLTEGVAHQGVVGVAPRFAYRALDELGGADLVVALDGITDPQNLGAIARTAEAAGAAGLVLPSRRAAGVTPAAEKAAAGAFAWLAVAQVPNLVRALASLADTGLWSVALDATGPRTIWEEPLLDGPVVVVVGAEGRGLARLTAERVDARARIDLAGHVASLNASAAAAVALLEVRRRRTTSAPAGAS